MQIVSVLDKPIAAKSFPGQSPANTASRAPVLLIAWVLFCAFCNCAGWVLSAFHRLNLLGYMVAGTLCAVLIFISRKSLLPISSPGGELVKLNRRFRRPFPLSFLALA